MKIDVKVYRKMYSDISKYDRCYVRANGVDVIIKEPLKKPAKGFEIVGDTMYEVSVI